MSSIRNSSGVLVRGRSAGTDGLFLLFLPMLFLPLAVWMGFREMELLCLLILFASPSTVTASIMARNTPGADWQLASQIVVFSTCLSVVSLFGFIYVLLGMGLL